MERARDDVRREAADAAGAVIDAEAAASAHRAELDERDHALQRHATQLEGELRERRAAEDDAERRARAHAAFDTLFSGQSEEEKARMRAELPAVDAPTTAASAIQFVVKEEKPGKGGGFFKKQGAWDLPSDPRFAAALHPEFFAVKGSCFLVCCPIGGDPAEEAAGVEAALRH
eukprot:gene38292-3012_t